MDGKDWRVLAGVGMVLVRPADGGMFEVWEDPDDEDDSYLEAEADLAAGLRPLISFSQAEAAVEKLASPLESVDLMPSHGRLRSCQAAFDDGSFETLVDALRQLYNTPDSSTADRANLDRLEETLFPELAHVLGTAPRKLRDQIRRRAGDRVVPPAVDLPDRSAELERDVLPVLDGWSQIGALAIESAIAIGDRPMLPARSGVWHAFYRVDEFDIPCEVVVAHGDVSTKASSLLDRTIPDVHQVLGARGSIEVCDAARAKDRDWQAARFYSADCTIVEGRGFWVYMESDGDDHPGLVIEDGDAVLVHITAT